MNRKKKEYNCYYYFSNNNRFKDQVIEILEQINPKEKVLRIVFFGSTSDTRYEQELALIKELAQIYFGKKYPLISYITQPVLGDNKLAAEVHYHPATLCDTPPVYLHKEDVRYLLLKTPTNKTIMIEGVRGGNLKDSVRKQSDEVFRKIEFILTKEGFDISDITRQWNYIGGITNFEGSVQNYQAFNDSRSLFYEKANWTKHGYPAATGIGMECGGVVVELIASRLQTDFGKINAIDNPLQIAAHNYSQEVLLGKEDERLSQRSTPKFERAKTIWSEAGYTCFVSGTAAIRGEESLADANIHQQTLLTIENINHLVSIQNQQKYGAKLKAEAEVSSVRIYVKKPEDYECVWRETELNWGPLPALYVLADVCRDELLVEIEGVASILY